MYICMLSVVPCWWIRHCGGLQEENLDGKRLCRAVFWNNCYRNESHTAPATLFSTLPKKYQLSLQIIATMVMSILALATLVYFISLNAVGMSNVSYNHHRSYHRSDRRGFRAMVRETKILRRLIQCL